MKRYVGIFFALILAVSFSIAGCSSSSDGGGSGAEFDSSLYYTKTEVDTLLANMQNLITTWDSSATDVVLASGNDSYANGAQINFDSSALAGFYQISVTNTSGTDGYVIVTIGTASDNNSSYTIYVPDSSQGTMQTILSSVPYGDATAIIKAWADISGISGGTLGTNVHIGVSIASYIYKEYN